jgi:two-component system, OmpR family, response regulator
MIKVLVADDTKNIRILLMKCLQLEGYEVRTANDGGEALEALLHGAFDLAFLDIKMPLFSGTEVLKKAREMGICTPVIIITAYATVKNAVECTQMGAVAYLQKPFTADKVRNVLAELECSNTTLSEGAGDIGDIVERLSGEGNYKEALRLLKKELSVKPLEVGLYLLLSQVSEKLGLAEDAKKYRKLYESIV